MRLSISIEPSNRQSHLSLTPSLTISPRLHSRRWEQAQVQGVISYKYATDASSFSHLAQLYHLAPRVMTSAPLMTIPSELKADVISNLAPLLIGTLFSVCFFGANTLQTWYYYQHYPGDSSIRQCMVAFVWILAVIHTVFACHAVWFYLIAGFGDPVQMDATSWLVAQVLPPLFQIFIFFRKFRRAACGTVILTGITAFTVHSFFAWRVYIMGSRKLALPIFTLVLSVLHMAATWGVAVISFIMKRWSDPPHNFRLVSILGLGFSAAADIVLALSLGYSLHRARSGLARSNRLINRLIFWAINIGLLTGIVGFVLAVLILAKGVVSLSLGVYMILGNLYAASMLATLNQRPFTQQHTLAGDASFLEFGVEQPPHARQGVEITITMDMVTSRDDCNEGSVGTAK
ncbi:hypothetical protein AB1N83_010197 [Pleurotus pulmonarius]